MRLRLANAEDSPAGLNLPWATPLEDWPNERCTDVERGLHRTPVRFVAHDGTLYAIKELLDDPPRRQRMARAAAERAKRFSLSHTFDEFWAVHLSACERASAEPADVVNHAAAHRTAT